VYKEEIEGCELSVLKRVVFSIIFRFQTSFSFFLVDWLLYFALQISVAALKVFQHSQTYKKQG
jgi:hypothetical protein